MFKKPPIVKASSNLKNSDHRKFSKSILSDYGLPKEIGDSAEFVTSHLFPKDVKQAVFQSRVNNTKGVIYIDSATEKPVWFDTRDSKKHIPTVYTLWKSPFLLPIVYTHMAVLEDHLANGSNLMIRGCVPPFSESLCKGALVAVSVLEAPKVMVAVGYCGMNLNQIAEITDNTYGVAVEILHCYKDELYKLDGKLEQQPLPKNEDIKLSADVEEVVRGFNKADEVDEVAEEVGELELKNEDENKADGIEEGHISEDEDDVSLTVEDIDDFFFRSLLYSIKTDPLDLPMSASIFMSSYVLKNMPPVSPEVVNMKKTSWRKAHKFFKAMEKQGILKLKGKGDDVTVLSVDKTNEKVAGFDEGSYRVKKNKRPKVQKDNVTAEMVVEQLFKPKTSSRDLFNELNKEYDRYYYENELKALVSGYINVCHLVVPDNPKLIRIDETLSEMGVKSSGRLPRVERAKVFAQVMSKSGNFQVFHRISKGEDQGKIRKGLPPKIEITVEQVRGRKKMMTRVLGLEQYYIQPEELAAKLKVKCSGSATLSEEPKSKQMEVSVQGSHAGTVSEVLEKEYKIRTRWIAVKEGKKK